MMIPIQWMRGQMLFLFVIAFASCVAMGSDAPQTPEPVRQEEMTREQFLPADVLSRVGLLRDELELVRFEMGKPTNHQAALQVSDATPREVYFQAITMFRKADRLARDLTALSCTEPDAPSVDLIRPGDVWVVVDAALARILVAKKRLGLSEQRSEQPMPLTTKPAEVYQSIVQANRQLNLLLEVQCAPSDAYRQVVLAVNYMERLLEQFPKALKRPPIPTLVRGKQSLDVYRRLIRCYGLLREFAKQSHIKILTLQVFDDDLDHACPSDVYDIASLLVSELAYMHALLDDAKDADAVFYPGRRFPSHVFQQAGIFEAQLIELREHVNDRPDWLISPGRLKQEIAP